MGLPSTGGTGGTDPVGGGGTGGGGAAQCTEGLVRGACPGTEICSEGAWKPNGDVRCEACGIVDCPASFPDCCSGFSAFALTAGSFLPNPQAITSFTVTPTQVVADFAFGQAYEIGAILLRLPAALPISSVIVNYSMEGNVYPDFTLELSPDEVGAVYWDGDDFDGIVDPTDPLLCFPNSNSCPSSYNQLSVRLRPYGSGTARLTVTGIRIGLE